MLDFHLLLAALTGAAADSAESLAAASTPTFTPPPTPSYITPPPDIFTPPPAVPDPISSGIPVWVWPVLGACVLLLFAVVLFLRQRSKRHSGVPGTQSIPTTDAIGPAPKLSVAKLHEQGARSEQQDSFGVSDCELVDTLGFVAVVADGMGGLKDGGTVSAAAAETVLGHFLNCQDARSPKELLLRLAAEANRSVNELLGPGAYRTSGSTLILGYVRGGFFQFLSIGDSRICLLRGGEMIQLNREHTYENELALDAINGSMSVGDALSDPKGHGLVSFLGMGQIEAYDMPAAPLRLLTGDRLILMSDGVYNALNPAEIRAAISGPLENAADKLHSAIEEKAFSNQDNYTAIILAYE